MDIKRLTAPCGLYCGVCYSYKVKRCRGCRDEDGKCLVTGWNENSGECKVYICTKEKGIHNCSECEDFPCDNFQPYLDMADKVYHNLKVYNICLIKKMGLEKWVENKAEKSLKSYFSDNWKL